ncbi:MAG: TRAP transporter substrate-binding protein DctP [Myxococcales bacterium]|nr:TRAP transporter substrate-binding protein DctP [Myxococcales bacterium]MCB9575602.1 TRAP transporter substrate-binding protein DctP [Polyangiaceae bacterium]
MRWILALLSSLVVVLACPFVSAKPEHSLRIATLAPKNSAWGKVFRTWQKAVDQKTKGRLSVEVYYNAVQGDEDSMVGKMKTGQIDGAALTSVGLSRIERDVLVLQLPGVVDDWDALGKARKAVGSELEKRFKAQGFTLTGWGDVGLVRQMSKGFAVRRPSDLRGKSPAVWRNEPMGPTVYTKIGGVVSVPVSPMEVLPALRAHKINVVSAPALAAEQLQWTPYLDHVASRSSVCAIGGSVIRTKALEALPADLRKVLDDMQERLNKATKNRIRRLDEAAYKRLTKKMKIVDLSQDDVKAWRKVLLPAVKQLSQGTLDKTLVEKVLKATGKS